MAVVDFERLSDALSASGKVGDLDTASILITVDGEGYPFVCMLSSRQLTVRGRQLVALVQSRRTIANLERGGRAALHLVHNDASLLARLQMHSTRTTDDQTLFFFEVSTLESERRSTILMPITYQLDEEILAREGLTIQEIVGQLDGCD